MYIDNTNKNRLISAAITLLFVGIVILVCALLKLYAPDPPIPEEGVEVALGYDESGLGEAMPTETAPSYSTPSANNEYATQSTEESVSLNSGKQGNVSKPQAENKPEETRSNEPVINTKALFNGKKNPTSGGTGQGNSSGTGQQGNPNGTPGATNYSGNPGAGYSLTGRKSMRLPEPSYSSSNEGKIVVKIWVNRDGKVIKADAKGQRGSTIADEGMIKRAEDAALKAVFSASDDAPETQTGTITYVYRKR